MPPPNAELWYFFMYHDSQRRYRRLMLVADTGMKAKMRALGYKNERGDWVILRSHLMTRVVKSDILEIIDIMELE